MGCGTHTGDGITKYTQTDVNEQEAQSLEKNGLKVNMKLMIKVKQARIH